MIYLITGVPGSGKTLYAVSTLLPKLAKEVYTRDDGSELRRRLVVDGIPDLGLDHALMASSTVGDKGSISTDGHGFANWYEWCQPGDVLVVDEVQRYSRPRALGTRPPECIQALETHRHKGVDFVFITQQPPLMDQNIRRLVGRHLHVRRLFGMSRAVVYEWDGCQVDTHRVAGATKSIWSYPRSAFAQYKSSELHTKQRHKLPWWFVVPVLALVGGLFVAPKAYEAMTAKKGAEVAQSKPGDAKPADPKPAATPAPAVKAPGADAVAKEDAPGADADDRSPGRGLVGFKMPMPDEEPKKLLAGCIQLQDRCECFDTDLLRVKVPDDYCPVSSHRVGQMPRTLTAGGGGGTALASAAARAVAPALPHAAPAPAAAPPAPPAAPERVGGRFLRPDASERLPADPRELEMLAASRPSAYAASSAPGGSLTGFASQ